MRMQQYWYHTARHRCRLFTSCIVGLVLSLTCVDSSGAQPAEPVKLEHFQFVRAITLSDPDSVQPDPLLIAEIRSLDVAKNGRMLVVDMLGQQAFLFGPDGHLLAVLDPSICHPGFEVRPVNAKFIGDQSIFLSNAGPWGYRFTPEGGCLGSVDPDYSLVANSGFLKADSEGGLVGLYRRPDTPVARYMDASGKLIQEIALPASEYPNASHRIDMGGVITDETHLFYAGAVEWHILKLTRGGAVVDKISHRTSWFRDVSQDLPDLNRSNPAELMQAAGQLLASSTIISGLFELTDQTIMVQYSNGDRAQGYQVFTKDGQLVAQELGIRLLFEHGTSGQVYRVVQPDLDEAGELPNPYIEVYQFITP